MKYRVISERWDEEGKLIEQVKIVEAIRFWVVDGALVFTNETYKFSQAFSPHQWVRVELEEEE